MEIDADDGPTYRPTRRGATATTATGLVAIVVGGVATASNSAPRQVVVTLVVVGVVLIGVAILLSRMRTMCTEGGLLVNSGLRTSTIIWMDVLEIRAEAPPGDHSGSPGNLAGVAYVRVGDDVDLVGLPCVNERTVGGQENHRTEITRIRGYWKQQGGQPRDVRADRAGAVQRFVRRQQRTYRVSMAVIVVAGIAYVALLILVG